MNDWKVEGLINSFCKIDVAADSMILQTDDNIETTDEETWTNTREEVFSMTHCD